MDKKESRYRFKAIKEKYKKNGNMITEDMYRYTDLDLGLLAVMGIILVILLFQGGFHYGNFQRLFFVVVFYYSWISRIIFIYENASIGSFLAPINEEICKKIVQMGDEEIELRESRRKRDLFVQFVFTCVFFYLYGTTEPDSYEWTEQLIYTLMIFAFGGIVCLPFLYYRHRATKRIQDVLLMKEIQRQSVHMQNLETQNMQFQSQNTIEVPAYAIVDMENTISVTKCPNCGHDVNIQSRFCSQCGENLRKEDDLTKTEQTVELNHEIQIEQTVQEQIKQEAIETENSNKNIQEKVTKKKGKESTILTILCVVVGTIIVILLIFLGFMAKDANKNVAETKNPINNHIDKDNIISMNEELEEDLQSSNSEQFQMPQKYEISSWETDEIDTNYEDSMEINTESSDYLLPESDYRYLTKEDLNGFSADMCRIARNEIYARYGRMFQDEELQSYFDSKEWYVRLIAPEDFEESILNEYEIYNRDLIVEYEKEQGYR